MSPASPLPPLPTVKYHFRSGAKEAGEWHVRAMQIVEELSGQFEARVEIEADDPAADPARLLGASATLILSRSTVPVLVRHWSGIVRRVEETTTGDTMKQRRGVVTLEPAFACLKETLLTRKFQEKTVPKVLRETVGGVEEAFERQQARLRLLRKEDQRDDDNCYAVRDLCVQYGETTYAFLRRLMSEEGMSYYFEQGEGAEQMVVVDDNTAFTDALGPVQLLPPGDKLQSSEAVHAFSVVRGRGPRRAEVHAYEPTAPRELKAERRREDADGADRRGEGLIHQPGTHVTPFGFADGVYRQSDIRVQAGLELERALARTVEGNGTGNVIGFAPGNIFTLATDLLGLARGGGKYLITSVLHSGENPERFATGAAPAQEYQNAFTCIPANVPFRPPLLPKPAAVEDWGVVVSAFKGDPIDTERHGRVRVRFGYDRERSEDDPAGLCSPWIPVLQGWAGDGYGLQIIPRAGMLVRIRYLFGDPDRPFVAGCLPTVDNVLPSALPEQKTRLTLRTRSLRAAGSDLQHFNEITLDDAAEREALFIHAGRDYHRKVLHDERTEIDHDETRMVGNDQTLEVKGQRTKTVHKDEVVTVKHKRTTTVQGDDSRHVLGKDSLTVEKEQVVTVHGPRTTTIDELETGVFLASRDEKVTGDDKLHVTERHVTIADGEWRAEQGPTHLSLTGGNARLDAGGNIVLEVQGAKLTMEKGGKALLTCDTSVSLVCDGSSIVMTPEKIEIASPEVQLTGAAGSIKLDRAGATTTGSNVCSTATQKNELTGAFVKAN